MKVYGVYIRLKQTLICITAENVKVLKAFNMTFQVLTRQRDKEIEISSY